MSAQECECDRKDATMPQFLIMDSDNTGERTCVLCGGQTQSSGLRLYSGEGQHPLCQSCGRRHAPCLAALLELGAKAARIGRVNQHAPFGPAMEDLLELARVAEQFYRTCTETR